MKTFASLTRTHSIGKATVALEGTVGGLIDEKKLVLLFVRSSFKRQIIPKEKWTPSTAKIVSSVFNNFIQDFLSNSGGANGGHALSLHQKRTQKQA